MNLKQFEEETRKFPFCPTPQSEDAHFAIRKPLMEMFGLKPEKSKLEKNMINGNGLRMDTVPRI